jgi:hypothetical protein
MSLPFADEHHDGQCESEFIWGPMAWTPCRCEERATWRPALPGETPGTVEPDDAPAIGPTLADRAWARTLAAADGDGGTSLYDEQGRAR